MLARSYRLPARYKLPHPKTIATPLFLLKHAPSPMSHSRCSVVVSKAVDKRATKRHELRRIIHHSIQSHLNELHPACDLLFILRKESGMVSKEQLREQVQLSVERLTQR